MSKSVNVDFVTRQIEVDTDGKEHFISAAMAAKDAEQSMLNAQNAAKEVKEIYGDGNFTPLSDLLGSLGTKLKRWGTIFANKVFASNLPIVYNSVAEMKADTMLWEGMTTKTLGYYEPNDGGGACYVIKSSSHQYIENLNNSLVAELIIKNGEVNIEQFGGKKDDDTFDNTPIYDEIIRCKKIKRVNFGVGTYWFTSIKLINGLSLNGAGKLETVLSPLHSSLNYFIYLDNGPIAYGVYSNFCVTGNNENLNQVGLYMRATKDVENNYHGGIWGALFKEVFVKGFTSNQMLFESSTDDYMTPNQFCTFVNCSFIGSNESNGDVVKMLAQQGQFVFINCNIESAKEGFYNIRTEYGDITFDHLSCQYATLGIFSKGTHAIYIAPWIEQVRKVFTFADNETTYGGETTIINGTFRNSGNVVEGQENYVFQPSTRCVISVQDTSFMGYIDALFNVPNSNIKFNSYLRNNYYAAINKKIKGITYDLKQISADNTLTISNNSLVVRVLEGTINNIVLEEYAKDITEFVLFSHSGNIFCSGTSFFADVTIPRNTYALFKKVVCMDDEVKWIVTVKNSTL